MDIIQNKFKSANELNEYSWNLFKNSHDAKIILKGKESQNNIGAD